MNTIGLKGALLSAALAALLLGVPPAAHADYKSGSGGKCLPYGASTAWGDLRYLPGAVTTAGDTDEFVVCSFDSDAENGWYNAATDASVSLHFKAGSLEAAVSCTATAGAASMYGTLTYTKSLTLPATFSGTLSINDMIAPGSYSWVPFSVVCRLPARATLSRIVLHETGPT